MLDEYWENWHRPHQHDLSPALGKLPAGTRAVNHYTLCYMLGCCVCGNVPGSSDRLAIPDALRKWLKQSFKKGSEARKWYDRGMAVIRIHSVETTQVVDTPVLWYHVGHGHLTHKIFTLTPLTAVPTYLALAGFTVLERSEKPVSLRDVCSLSVSETYTIELYRLP